MGRPKNFSREDVLQKAIPVFWERGFANTSLQDLEKATGVNKSGLYSEFESKEEIFLETLKYYLSKRDGSILKQEPLGWENIKNFWVSRAQQVIQAAAWQFILCENFQ